MEQTDKIYEASTLGKFLYIRHGQTSYNKADKTDISVKWNEEYIDCQLNDIGKSQAERISADLKDFKISKVFCSPMRRTLETCYLALKDHPQGKEIEVIVNPLITEGFSCIHDISIDIELKKKEFKGLNFNWSLFEGLDKYYNFGFIDKKYSDLVQSVKSGKSNVGELVKAIILNHERPESLKNTYERAQEFKKQLKGLENYSSGKILVFVHSGFMRLSTINQAPVQEDKYPAEVYHPKNCEIISIFP